MSRPVFAEILAAHLPRDRYDEQGESGGTYCTCGDWTGDYFADGEAGPFDAHLAAVLNAAVDAWLADEKTRDAVAEAVAVSGANYLTGVESSRLYDAYRFGDDAVRLQDVADGVAHRAAEQGAAAALAALTPREDTP
jgi:hypothetical protein